MRDFLELLIFILVANWVFDRAVDRRVDARLRAAGLPTPAKPKLKLPPNFWRDARRWFVLNGLFFGGLAAFILFVPRFAPPGPANEHPLWGIIPPVALVALLVVVAGLAIFWSRRDATALGPTGPTALPPVGTPPSRRGSGS
jgi:hypothetical protein